MIRPKQKTKKERQWIESQIPKCVCGSSLSRDRQNAGIRYCPACDTHDFDLDKMAWEQIKNAASESEWMPPEYTMNDWVSDVCRFLRNGLIPAK